MGFCEEQLVIDCSLLKLPNKIDKTYLPALQMVPNPITQSLFCVIVANSTNKFLEEDQNFLISQSVQRSSQAAHRCCKWQVGVRQSRSNQVRSVSRNVAALKLRFIKFNKIIACLRDRCESPNTNASIQWKLGLHIQAFGRSSLTNRIRDQLLKLEFHHGTNSCR